MGVVRAVLQATPYKGGYNILGRIFSKFSIILQTICSENKHVVT